MNCLSTIHELLRGAGRMLACSSATLVLLGSSACSGSETSEAEDAVVIGLLLPFTGASSATAANFERAALYAAARVNASGGVQGRSIRIVSKDTHSDLERGRGSALALIAEGASVVIGPEDADIANELLELFTDHGVVFVSPLVGDAGDQALDCSTPWFRLAPSAKALGQALAKQLAAEEVQTLAVLSSAGAYDQALSRAAADRFSSLGGTVLVQARLSEGAPSHAAEAAQALEADVDAVLLAASARSGALVVSESQFLTRHLPRWSLSPLLKTELFTLNVDPSAVEDALGVAPKIFDQSEEFPHAFRERWLGDVPLEGAYFYYDAVSLIAFALELADTDRQGNVAAESLRESMAQVAAPPGEAAGWNEIERGLRRLAEGRDMYYSGLTGPMLLDACGARRLGITSSWTVRSGEIVTVE